MPTTFIFFHTIDAGERAHRSHYRLLCIPNGGIKAFMSSEFHHDDDGNKTCSKGTLLL
jgi:hypothetical protein